MSSNRVSGVGVDVAAARAICDAATAGPWSIEWDSHDAECQINPPFPYAIRMTAAPKYGAQEWADQYRGGELLDDDYNRTEVSDLSDADAEFIVAAREGWPAALDEIERLRETVRQMQSVARGQERLFHEAQAATGQANAALDRVINACDENERFVPGIVREIRAAASVSPTPEKPE